MTPDAYIVLIVFGSIAFIVGVIAFAIVTVVNGGKRGSLSNEESQLMQELYHGFTEMERRVESLETLLLEKDRKRD
ncbi:MAG: hypothetical protein GC168_15450 [Candidatus Hydrogenedens sp.]|nr:hypothetical protein [Candidatus Hydrogenedens sp.]